MGVDLGTGLLDPSDPFSSILRRDQLVAQIDQPLIIPTPIPHHDTIFDDSDNDYQSGNNHTDEITAAVNSYKAEWGRPDSVLQPISTDPPLPLFKERIHPVKPMRVRVEDQSKPQPTNKFYGNLMLGDSHSPIWTHPYGLRWDRIGKTQHGLSISHVDDSSKAFGPPEDIDVSGSGQTKLDEQHEMTVGNFEEFSCAVELTPASERALEKREPPTSVLRIPIVRGMVFISALYRNLTPQFYSNAVIRTLELDPRPMADGCVKYRFLLENGVTWLLYAKPDRSMDGPLRLEMHGQGLVVATSGRFMGLVQIAKLPVGKEDETEKVYDQAMGVRTGGYRIDWKLAGDTTRQFIHFTLPHHRDILTDKNMPTALVLPSTTKGKMVAYTGSSWHLSEPHRLPLGFLPDGWENIVSPEQLAAIKTQAQRDIARDFDEETNMESMYFAGKGLAKFALLCLVVKDVLHETDDVQRSCLDKLENAFARFMENRQLFPLVYDTVWQGIVTSQGWYHGALCDFGNAWYNDHHYHYGYFIHAGAIIRHLDPDWRSDELTAYVDTLWRDVANASADDKYFPRFRAFDWFMGHSWSQGIFVSLDGKDEESTSEDINLYYAMALWGRVSNRPEMDRMGEMMLTIARRSIKAYFLMENDNVNHPRAFLGNKVTGILFENKVDHTTYFSPRLECIQGIQMIPATPALPLIRSEVFVRQEWEGILQARVDEIEDGWKSILMMNYGTLDKAGAWKYFAESEQPVPLDDGMTLTWAMFYVASLSSS
ncbi:hypothetical protein BGZ97_007184 [Linnemannia gamsii]|uniref:glucan endo-1,3-beta-D-glucosidase n=1 Tax=Linnemannia gamsii TaxID=64522 RepID=A0A9P6URC4_9FUNG|nr:hypothetical protein BGZ97_007184 [Linnemannia gamsii]